MENIAVRKASELNAAARDWMRSVFGRELSDEETITVLLSHPHPAPVGASRQAAVTRLERALDHATDKLSSIPADEIEGAIDEAMNDVRRWKN